MKILTYIEIDIPSCTRTYGVAPCTAALGVTGSKKCFNTPKTCQDRPHYNETLITFRFGIDTGYLPPNIDCIPSLVSATFDGAQASLGTNLGIRGTLTATFRDHLHSDAGTGFDQYLSSRSYNPLANGTFWGKFRARNPFLRARKIRLIRGILGQSLAEMETRNFVIEAINGPTTGGSFTITAKDVLKLADNDRSKYPKLSNGSLNAGITNAATTATLKPAGIGNAEYLSLIHI